MFAVSSVMLAVFCGYLWLALGEVPALHGLRGVVVQWGIVMSLGCMPINIAWAYRAHRVMRRLERALAAGTPPAALDRTDALKALTLYRPVATLMLVEWLSGSALLPVVVRVRLGAEMAERSLPVAAVGALVGVTVSVLVFYVLFLVVRARISPVLLATGSLEHLRPFRSMRVYHHVALLFLVIAVVLPATAMLLLMAGASSAYSLGYLVGVFIVVGLLQGAVTVTTLSRASGHLAARMREVREGDLSVTANVGNLDTLGELASDFNGMVQGLRQRDTLRETFGRYVTRQVAEEILAGRIALGGERRTATVLFSDIRGFTELSERLPPEEVVTFLNTYLEMMVGCVFDHGGILDKFIGDAIMAVFGVPVASGSVEDDARAAVKCAVEMMRRLDAMNDERRARGEAPINIGIGVHTGELVAGNIGSLKRMEYTVIGDTVNLTSRLEGLTKTLGHRVLVSDATHALVGDGFRFEALPPTEVRGRQQPVHLHALLGLAR